ncbi:O-antigen ligase family protein [Rhodanobacter sp. DHB23]|uniref:O-antigen ligase family protein n=1 Tax=Rhodanobacter sp. DHB23 TaxID=2775923 RepID=UPI00177E4C40|nr:O-antigen ligase family protein [Rhodanobacter sp. DHB23]MBD8874624.1 O-antigen ligase family protein [Rhodanobacter sp. DHB23]
MNKPATNVTIVLSVVLSLLGSDMRQRWRDAARHPVAQGALVWWAVLMLSAAHTWLGASSVPRMDSFVWACWYPLVLGSLLRTAQWRNRALLAFALAMTLVLLASYGMDFGLLPQRPVVHELPQMRNTLFKEYTQQGLDVLVLGSMALAAALVTRSRPHRRLLYTLAILALINVIAVLESRTAYLTLVPLLAYWAWRLCDHWRLDRRTRWAGAGLILAGLAMACYASPIRQRLLLSVTHETEAYIDQSTPTSTGIRLELWQHTLPIIASAPVFGHGLSQWFPLYKQSIEGMPDYDKFLMGHPHQEMLLILSEQGIVGLAVFLGLLAALARYISRLASPYRDFYACLLLIYLTAGLANCLWADFSHRHMFILLLACIPLAGAGTASGAEPHKEEAT